MNPKDKNRQERLSELQDRHGALTREKQELQRQFNRRMSEISKETKSLGQAIYDLKNIDGDTPHITDHAIVRYLERVKGMDIWDLKSEIMNHADAVRIVNTIVTVNGKKDEVCHCKDLHYVWHTYNCPITPGEKVE